MYNFRANRPITYVANGMHGPGNSPATAAALANFDDIDVGADQQNSVYAFLRDSNANEVDYTNWRIGNHTNGTNLASKHRIAFGLALSEPFSEPTIYEYTIAGFTDSTVELIPFVGQLYHYTTLHQDGEPHAWNGSQDIATDNSNTPYNLCTYHLLPSQQDKGFSLSAAGKIAMHDSYGISFTAQDNALRGTVGNAVILGVIAFNDQTSVQNLKNTDISISGRRLPLSADEYKSIPYTKGD